MPQLGESVTEGTIGKWLVKPGDTVKKYQPLAEVITDKVNAEIPAPADGEIATLDIADGVTVKVGTLIATMNAGQGAVAVGASDNAATPAAAGQSAATAQGGDAAPPVGARSATLDKPRGESAGRFSPAVLKLAQEHNIDLARIRGTGMGGRITRKDVEEAIAGGGTAAGPAVGAGPSTAPAASATPAGEGRPVAIAQPGAADQTIPVDPVRRRIAEKMVQSKHEAPHAWMMMEADVTGLVKLKEQQGEHFKLREGVSLSFVPFFIKAVVESLKEYPIINSQWAGDKIVLKNDINISIAVATETSLAVPVIKNADRLSITGLNHAVADLAGRARAGRLTVDDISGGTFTVNNTGYFGSVLSAPIINHPQAAILSFEAIRKAAVVLENDAIAIRSIMNMCMSLDHRILDGLVCARFVQAVKNRIEAYAPGTVSL